MTYSCRILTRVDLIRIEDNLRGKRISYDRMSKNFRKRRLIVGVDPGLNCGLAILTFNGTPVLVESHRGWSLTRIIERITRLGEPTIISSDVSPASSLLENLSKKLNAVLFEPVISMSSEEKHKLARAYVDRYNIKVENMHEIDALAAAIKAYQHYKNKFEQVDARLKEGNINLFPDDVKDLVVRGYSISRAIKVLQKSDASRMRITVNRTTPREKRMKELIEELTSRLMLEKERCKRLRDANRELRLKIKALNVKIENLQEALRKVRSEQTAQIRREREYRRLAEEIDFLKNKIKDQEAQIEAYRQTLGHFQRLRNLEAMRNLVLLKPIEQFTREGLEKAFKLYNIRVGDLVFILDSSGGGSITAENLVKRGVKAIVIRGNMSHQALEVFEKYYVPVIPADELNIRWREGLPYANSEEVKRLIRERRKIGTSDNTEMLKMIISDYLRDLEERRINEE